MSHAVETVFRIERARLVAGLARITRDISAAEDLAQEALVAALADWPQNGVPRSPGAWLMATAKRRAIDGFRRSKLARRHAEEAAHLADTFEPHTEPLGDDLLALIFTACHPVLSPDARAALTLRLIGGLTTDEIARAFLVPEPTIAARITRAKKAIAKARAPFEIPEGADLLPRLASVLEVLYLIFNEGYAATAGADLIRPTLCAEARRLARILASLLPDEAEVHGLSALMDLQASRLAARVGADGGSIPLPQQNRAAWDHLLIQHGLASLARAERLADGDRPYTLQAALAACHARARGAEATDWHSIAGLYDRLLGVMPSPVVALNRAVAHSMAFGPETGLALLDELSDIDLLRDYAPLPAARGDCLMRAGRRAEAAASFRAAAALTRNAAERAFLLGRAEACLR